MLQTIDAGKLAYMPGAQPMQVLEPVLICAKPVEHDMQEAAKEGEYRPAAHALQAIEVAPTVDEYRPVEQLEQADAPRLG